MSEQDGDNDDFDKVYEPWDHATVFEPLDYLNSFYAKVDSDSAMNLVLFYMPGLCTFRIPKGGTLLDVGTGPAITPAIAFRDHVEEIYLSDFAPQNRRMLASWWAGEKSDFDWSNVINFIKSIQCCTDQNDKIQDEARRKVKGILNCDVFRKELLDQNSSYPSDVVIPEKFDIITTTYCLEYATQTKEQYLTAVLNVLERLKPGGFLFLSAILEASTYYFGNTKFKCMCLTKDIVLEALNMANMDIETMKLVNTANDMCVLIAQKKQI